MWYRPMATNAAPKASIHTRCALLCCGSDPLLIEDTVAFFACRYLRYTGWVDLATCDACRRRKSCRDALEKHPWQSASESLYTGTAVSSANTDLAGHSSGDIP